MARRPRRTLPNIPIESTVEHLCTHTFMAPAAVDEETAAIAAATDPLARAKLVSCRVRRHVENAHASMVFAEVRNTDARGILQEPERLRRELRMALADIRIALDALDGLDWSKTALPAGKSSSSKMS